MQKYQSTDDLQADVEIESASSYEVDLSFDPTPPGFHKEWQDEANIEEHYVNVYIPVPRNITYYRFIVDEHCPETIEWLNEQVGSRRAHGIEWYQRLSEDVFDWSIRGVVIWKDTNCYQVMIKSKAKALIFKLTWGGL